MDANLFNISQQNISALSKFLRELTHAIMEGESDHGWLGFSKSFLSFGNYQINFFL